MRIGFHVSIVGGFRNVIQRAVDRKCETLQLFSRNPRAWKYRALDKEDIGIFKKGMEQVKISPIFVHMPYLVNLASSDKDLFQRSVDSLVVELQRTALINAHFVIMHIGSCPNEEKGLRSMIRGINQALQRTENKIILLLENTPKSGHELGYEFTQIKEIIDGIKQNRRIGVVLDTAHAFAAGYPLHTKHGVARSLAEFDEIIGIDKLMLVHLNDSKTAIGSCRDRHWHVGKGNIGKGMGYILNHCLLQDKPFILETPRKNLRDDLMNLKTIKEILKEKGKYQ